MLDTILQGDVRECLKQLEEGSVQCCITSPPYWGLRSYGIGTEKGEIGLEPTPDGYVADLVAVFQEVKRVLRNDGILWLVIGDTYAGSWGDYVAPGSVKHQNQSDTRWSRPGYEEGDFHAKPPSATIPAGLKKKDLCMIPARVAIALQTDGWWIRSDIIWAKPGPVPESVKDRCTRSHEYVFMLTKSADYYCDMEAIKEKSITGDPRTPYGSKGAWDMRDRPVEQRHGGEIRESVKRGGFNGKTNDLEGREAFRAITESRNKRDVWTVATQPCAEAHFATFPPKLIEPMILAGTPEGGVVLDPFMGSGTTAIECVRLHRHYMGCELNPEYVKMAERRIADMIGPLFVGET